MVKKSPVPQGKVYIVEDILDTRLLNGIQSYRVKWKGYNYSNCTWQPEQSFNCSKQILNQFLLARATKQPAFKQKLMRIQKEREALRKIKGDSNEGQSIDKQIKERKYSFGKKQDEKEENKCKMQEENFEHEKQKPKERLNNEGKGKENSSSGRQRNETLTQSKSTLQQRNLDSIKMENEESNLKDQKSSKIDKKQTISQNSIHEKSNASEKNSSVKSTESSKPTQTQSHSQSEFKILMINKQQGVMRFVVIQNGLKVWKSREQMHTKYAAELCQYYEKHIIFDQ